MSSKKFEPLDPFAPGSAEDPADDVDLARDGMDSDPNFDFTGWAIDPKDGHLEPPADTADTPTADTVAEPADAPGA